MRNLRHSDRTRRESTALSVGSPPPQAEMAPAAALPEVTTAALTTLLDLSPDAMVVVDGAGRLVLANEQAAALFGYRRDELVGQPVEVLLPERWRTLHAAHRADYAAAPRPRSMGVGLDLVGRCRDGGEFPVDISLRPVLVEGALHVAGAIRDVSAQRRLEQERAQQIERLRVQTALIDAAHDAILVRDPISRVVSWNRGAEELYGWTAREALGRLTHTLLRTRFPARRRAIEAQLEREGRWEGELVHTRRDGSTVAVESRWVLVRDEQARPSAVLEIDRDITERRRLEQAQDAAQAASLAQRTFLQQTLDALPSGVHVVHGPEARLLVANRAAASIWGAVWRPGQPMRAFLGAHGIRIVDGQGRPFPPDAWATMRALLRGETVLQHQEVIRRPAGDSLPILVNAVPLASPHWRNLCARRRQTARAGGEPPPGREREPMALVIHQDVTTLKEAEYLKDEFIGVAAHELRAPLAVLKAAVSTLVLQTARGHGPELADWQREMLQEVDEATDRLTDLADDLLDATRLQAGRLLLQRAPTNLVALAQRVVGRAQQTTTRHRLELQTPRPTLEANVDPGRVEQVLSNLVSNALKYSPQGGPVVVALGVDAATHVVTVRVTDRGIGIPRQQQAQIFGRFMRADNARAAGIGGTGLGLYLCHALVEQHGGQLWFESMEGEGTTFFVTLPLVAPLQHGTIAN